MTEQWGRVVTRHDFYTCKACRDTLVSTNGREPETAAGDYKVDGYRGVTCRTS